MLGLGEAYLFQGLLCLQSALVGAYLLEAELRKVESLSVVIIGSDAREGLCGRCIKVLITIDLDSRVP